MAHKISNIDNVYGTFIVIVKQWLCFKGQQNVFYPDDDFACDKDNRFDSGNYEKFPESLWTPKTFCHIFPTTCAFLKILQFQS